MRNSSLVPALAVALGLVAPLGAATTCVSRAAQLQAALTAAQANGADDVIQVEQGTYSQAATFTFTSSEAHALQVLGGYTAGCAGRVLNPANTVLDGLGAHQVLAATIGNGAAGGDLLFEGFTVQGGSTTDSGALRVATIQGATGSVTVRFNVIRNNANTAANVAGLSCGVFTGTLTVSNNLFHGNTAPSGGTGAAEIVSGGGTLRVIHNTVTANTVAAPVTTTSGLRLYQVSGTPAGYVANNILWGNASGDMDLVSIASGTLEHNDIGSWSTNGVPTTESGDLNMNPLFVGASDFHLQAASPVANQGTATPAGGLVLPTQDLDGNPRVVGPAPDMGAYESATLPVSLQRFAAE